MTAPIATVCDKHPALGPVTYLDADCPVCAQGLPIEEAS